MTVMFKFFLCVVIAVVFFLLGGASVAFFYSFREPSPVKAYRKHRDSILAYVASIHAGKIPLDKGVHGGYVLLDVLYPEGLTAVIPRDDGSIHFVFESMPFDSTPSLVYCPKTSFDLRQITPIGGTAIIKGQFLDPHWFYIEADDE